MATEEAIAAVALHLPDEAEDLGLDENTVAALIDSGLTQTKVILTAWRMIAAKTIMVEDVSESGSSRTNRVHDNAREMIAIWQSRSDAEDKALLTDGLGRGRFASHRATRV